MKKKTIITLIILLILLLALLVMCIPRIRRYKDGGTVEYKAILYSVQKVHSISYGSYAEGTKIRILFWTVYDDVVWPAPSDDESGVSVTDNPDTPAKSEEEIIEGTYFFLYSGRTSIPICHISLASAEHPAKPINLPSSYAPTQSTSKCFLSAHKALDHSGL
ncbi:MAG: hypothetical protein K5776_09260 [Lachnospiraceae bacterium]|nr:hypothetical protein [Lachnospiraceae bacterium]